MHQVSLGTIVSSSRVPPMVRPPQVDQGAPGIRPTAFRKVIHE